MQIQDNLRVAFCGVVDVLSALPHADRRRVLKAVTELLDFTGAKVNVTTAVPHPLKGQKRTPWKCSVCGVPGHDKRNHRVAERLRLRAVGAVGAA